MKTNNLKAIVLNLLVLLFIGCIQSCSTEESLPENDSPIKTVTKEEALSYLKDLQKKKTSKSSNNAYTIDYNSLHFEIIENTNNKITVLNAISSYKKHYSRILLLKINNQVKSIVISMYSDKKSNSPYFSGEILITDFEGNYLNGFRATNGVLTHRLSKSAPNSTYSKTTGEICTIHEANDPHCINNIQELNEIVIAPKTKLTYISIGEMYGDVGGNTSTFCETECAIWSFGSGSSNNRVDEEAIAEIAQKIEDSIDDSKLDPCTKAIIEKLKNSTEKDIAKMITRFTDPKSIFKINMSIGQMKNDINLAETTPVKGSQTDINIVFKYDYINGTGYPNRPTDLSIATTMAHEIIHAYLISLLEAHKSNGSNGSFDFPTIYEAYVQQQITKSPNILASEHHEIIAKQYVFAIATTIQEFHTGQYTDYPYQDYIDLAWGGLTGTTIFNTNFPNDLSHKNYKTRERILNRINAEKLGLFYQNTTPLGTPCKK